MMWASFIQGSCPSCHTVNSIEHWQEIYIQQWWFSPANDTFKLSHKTHFSHRLSIPTSTAPWWRPARGVGCEYWCLSCEKLTWLGSSGQSKVECGRTWVSAPIILSQLSFRHRNGSNCGPLLVIKSYKAFSFRGLCPLTRALPLEQMISWIYMRYTKNSYVCMYICTPL